MNAVSPVPKLTVKVTPRMVVEAHAGETVVVPGGDLLLTAEFIRSGDNLILKGGDGRQVMVAGWYDLADPPPLATAAGAQIPADLAMILAGPLAPGLYAQAGDPAAALQYIGIVSKLTGQAFVRHGDGTREPLALNAKLAQGDIIETGDKAAVGLVLADNSTFALGAKGRMVLDDMVFDPGRPNESHSQVSVVQGTFTFVSGEVAKAAPDAMKVRTPVMTIGVRGTTVAGFAAAEGTNNTVTLLDQGAGTGQISISTAAGTQVMSQPFQSVQLASFTQPPPPPVTLSPAQVQAQYGDAISARPAPPPPGQNPISPQNQQQQQQQGQQGPAEGGPNAGAAGTEAAAAQEAAAKEGQAAAEEAIQEAGKEGLIPEGAAQEALAELQAAANLFLSATDLPGGMSGSIYGVFTQAGAMYGAAFGSLGFLSGGGDFADLFNPIAQFNLADDPFAAENQQDFQQFLAALNELADIPDLIDVDAYLPPQLFDDTDYDEFIELSSGADTEVEVYGENTAFRVHDAFSDPYLGAVATTIGGADIVEGGDGTDQLAVDALTDMWLKVESGNVQDAGMVSFYTASLTDANPTSTITYSGIEKFLFASEATFSGFTSASNPTFGNGPQTQYGTLVFDAMGTNEVGYVYAGTTGADTITIPSGTDYANANIGALAGVIAFGKGGGDTFSLASAGKYFLVGGDSNANTASNGFVAQDITSLELSDLSGPGALTESAGDYGLLVRVRGQYGMTGTDLELVDRNSLADPLTAIMAWNIGKVTLTSGADTIVTAASAVAFGSLSELALGGGDNYASIDLGISGSIHSITAGAGADTVIVSGGDATLDRLGTVDLGDGANIFSLDASDGLDLGSLSYVGGTGTDTVTFTGSYSQFDAILSLDGGAGTADKVTLLGGFGQPLTLDNVTNFETIQLGNVSNSAPFWVTLADTNAAASATMTVDGFHNTDDIRITGSAETNAKLILWGGSGDDIVYGGQTGDSLTGAPGADTLAGNQGTDTLTGGLGADTFLFRQEGGNAAGDTGQMTNIGTDLVTDWSSADFIALSDATFNLGASGTLTENTNYFENTALANVSGTGAGIIALQNSVHVDLYYCSNLADAGNSSYQIAQLQNTGLNDISDANITRTS
jgi:Ca2+-binding RTX toxin-like protein